MSLESMTIIRVTEDHHVIEAGGTLTITFMPSRGPTVIRAHSSIVPDDVIVGGSPGRLVPDAERILEALDPPFKVDSEARFVLANRATPLAPQIGNANALIAQPDFGLGEVFLGGDQFGLDFDLGGGGGVVLPEPKKNIRLEILRPSSTGGAPRVVFTVEVSGRGSGSFDVTDLPLVGVGFAPPAWIARFTNIDSKPLQIFGSILFREVRQVEAHDLPVTLLQRLMRQALEGLGLSLNLNGSQISIDFNALVKELAHLERIEKDIGFSVFGDVSLSEISVELSEALSSDNRGPWPTIKLMLGFEEAGPEISLDLGADVDINLSGLQFEFEIILAQRQPALNPPGVRGDHPLLPFIFAEINFDTEIRFSSRKLGITRSLLNGLIDAVNGFVGVITGKDRLLDRIPTLAQVVRSVGEEFANDLAFGLSEYIQIAINRIADRDSFFHGLRLSNGTWRVLTGPVFGLGPRPLNEFPTLPLADPEPIDGPQPPEELEALGRIDHFVVLMMENRSYDHVLGWHSHPAHGNDPRFEGLTGNESNSIVGLQDAIPIPMQTTKFFPSPPHGFGPVAEQVDNGLMSGFGNTFKEALERKGIAGDARSIMNFNTRGMLPVFDRLVNEYTVANRWFASLPGPTWPNRFCWLSGQTPILDNGDLAHDDLGYIEMPTVFDLLDEFDVNWRCYESDIAFMRMLRNFRIDAGRLRPIEQFEDEALAGLPPVTIIEPNFVDIPSGGVANDDHPGGADMINGQRLVAQIYNVLIRTPGWRNTMFIITYDEHGGFFDHVPPPGSAVAANQGFGDVQRVHPEGPSMLGVRVPAFVISPRADPGQVLTRVYDHTSIIKSIIARFTPGNEHRLSRRVETAAHLGGAVPRTEPRVDALPLQVPSAAPPSEREILDPLSFHDDMTSLGNPMRQSVESLTKLLPRLAVA